jgi:hypothetical protein
MAGYAHITRCAELTEDDVVSALEDRRLSKALLERLARVARPGEGAPKILHFLARMAGGEVAWIEGTLRVEVVADGEGVTVEVLGDLGGVRERLFPLLKVGAPFREFARMVDHMPRTVEPLVLVSKAANRLALEVIDEGPATASMPQVAIADDSLYRGRRTTRPKLGPKAGSVPPRASGSSGKLRAARRASIPAIDMPPRIPARSGATLRPAVIGVPPSSRNQTLRPDLHGVPPPIPAVPQAPRIPRVDPDEPGAPRMERARSGRPTGQPQKLAPKGRASAAPKATSRAASDPPPRTKRGSKPKVEKKAESLAPASRSSANLRAARADSLSEDLDWEIPSITTVLPPSSQRGDTLLPDDGDGRSDTLLPNDEEGRGDTLLPGELGVPPQGPVAPSQGGGRPADAGSKSRPFKAVAPPKPARASSAKNPKPRSIHPRHDPRSDDDE